MRLTSDARILREGLNRLQPMQRVVFVLRAILGRDSVTLAALLEQAGCHGWGAAQVGEVFRQALCSVSTLLVHSVEARG